MHNASGGKSTKLGYTISSIGLAAILTSCGDAPSAPVVQTSSELAFVCHITGSIGSVIDISISDLPMHKAHGDYVAQLTVDKQSSKVGDSIHFTRIGDAIAVARAVRMARNESSVAACRITIAIAPGVFQGSIKASTDPSLEQFPLVLDVPDMTLQGSFKMAIDAGGRPTGIGEAAEVTTLVPIAGLLTVNPGGGAQNTQAEPLIIVNAHPDGPRGDRASIEGIVFQSGNGTEGVPGGHAIFAMRAANLVIRRNKFESGFAEPMDLRASSARVEQNYLTGRGGSCGICLSGPGDYQATGNRHVGPGGLPGIFVTPLSIIAVNPIVEQFTPLSSAFVAATLVNNEVRNHQTVPPGTGIRIGAVALGAPNVAGTSQVVVRDNTLINNRFGIIVDAAFPVANTALRGDIEVTLSGNTMTGSCQTNLLVTLTRHVAALGIVSLPYLKNSTYKINLGGDLAWSDVWYTHPSGFNNTVIVDGQTIPTGSRAPYDAARTCPQ